MSRLMAKSFIRNVILVCNFVRCKCIVLYETRPLQWVMGQQGSNWCPSALVPGHQKPQCWLHTYTFPCIYGLTQWGRVTHICVSKLTIIGSDNGFVAWPAPSRYLNQRWNIVNRNPWNKFQWNFNQNSYILIKNLKMSSAKWRPFCLGLNVLKPISSPFRHEAVSRPED